MRLRDFLLLLAVSPALLAQMSGPVSGRVVDPSGAAVGGALVELHSRDGSFTVRAVSNGEGAYQFQSVPPGEYLVDASAGGFGPSDAHTVFVETTRQSTQNLALKLAGVAARIVVTASGVAESTDQTSKAFDVIDTAELERRHEVTLPGALREVPGIKINQTGGPGALTTIFTRGLRSFDTSVLIDGFRLRDAAAPQSESSAYLADLLLVDSDRIEVLRGSGSSLYGTNAIAGVINVVSDQGGGPLHGDLNVEAGGLGTVRAVGRIAAGAWDGRLRYSAGIAHLNVADGVDGNDAYRNTTGQGYAQLRLTARSSLSGRVWANDARSMLNSSPFVAFDAAIPSTRPVPAIAGVTYTASLDDPDNRRPAHLFSGLLTFTEQLTPRASFRLQYSGLRTRRDYRDGPLGQRFPPLYETLNHFDGDIDTIHARTDFAAGEHQWITAGYEYEHERFQDTGSDANPDPAAQTFSSTEVRQGSHALFAQDQFTFAGDRLRVSLSGRLQTFALSRPTFAGGAAPYAGVEIDSPSAAYTGDASLAYFLRRAGTKLRAHVGNSYRAPSLYERFGASFYGGSFTAYGDPRLAPERAISVDAGVDQYLAASRVRLSATYFYTQLREVIGFDSSGAIGAGDPYGRIFGGYWNTRGGLARGLELSGEASPARRTTVKASYTYTRAQERISALANGNLRSYRIPDHMATVALLQSLGHGIDASFDLFHSSGYTFPFYVSGAGTLPFLFEGPTKADLAVSYRRPLGERAALEFYTRIENILDRTYYESGFETPRAWAVGGCKLLF